MSRRWVFIGLVLLMLLAGCVQKGTNTTTATTTDVTRSMPTVSTPPYCTGTYERDINTSIYTKGEATSYGWGHQLASKGTDYCINQTALMEYFCTGFSGGSIRQEVIDCLGGCVDGACVQSTTTTVKTTDVTHSMPVISTPPSCRDTDTVVLGNRLTADIYTKGVTYSSGWGHRINPEETDYCINQTTLMEYTCWTFSDTPIPEKIDCPEGCLEGACVRSATTETDKICFDSDGGIVYGGAGEVEDYDGTAWTTHKDTCLDNGFLIEWYCQGGAAKNTTTKCPATCGYGGMCYTTLQSTWATTTTTLT